MFFLPLKSPRFCLFLRWLSLKMLNLAYFIRISWCAYLLRERWSGEMDLSVSVVSIVPIVDNATNCSSSASPRNLQFAIFFALFRFVLMSILWDSQLYRVMIAGRVLCNSLPFGVDHCTGYCSRSCGGSIVASFRCIATCFGFVKYVCGIMP